MKENIKITSFQGQDLASGLQPEANPACNYIEISLNDT